AKGATVGYTKPAATDDYDPSPDVSCSPASGVAFPLGPTSVSCTATDASGNTSTTSFTVTVRDMKPPAITVPQDMTVEAAGPDGASFSFIPAPSAVDFIDGPVAVTCDHASGSQFALGTTQVRCDAVDNAGNASSAVFNVTVVDTL